jgi:hypothetical protein
VEPFAGSLLVLLARPQNTGVRETLRDSIWNNCNAPMKNQRTTLIALIALGLLICWGDGDVIGGANHLPAAASVEVDPDGATVHRDAGYQPVKGVAIGECKVHVFSAD